MMATTARHSGSIRAKEGVTDGGEAPSEDGGVVIIMTDQRQIFNKYCMLFGHLGNTLPTAVLRER